jgi:hypothetical protein
MGYLGNTPAESFLSFEKQVFTIVNSQTAYTLNFSVTNENDIRLVINNVIQEPGTGKAYTASGTTLTLSAALTNGTDEMYCVFLGRARETVTVPDIQTGNIADDAVTKAKVNFISDSTAGVEVKGDGGSNDGYIQLNCRVNSHGIKLKGPPHSAGQSYTMVYPTTNITAGKFLKVDSVSGSGATGIGQLSFADAGGGKILQVVGSSGTAGFDTNSTSYVAVTGTGHGLAITPSATSSKIFISIMFEARSSSVSNYSINTILRGSTNLATDRMATVYGSSIDFPLQLQFLDSPNTTSAITYSIGTKSNNSSHNSRINSSNQTFSYVAMEIGA